MSHETEKLLQSFSQAIQLDPARRRALIEGLEAEARAAEARELERLLELDQAEGPLAREPAAPRSRAGPANAHGSGSGPDRANERQPAADDKYEILGEIGEGAFGHIYRARHRSLKREVALKVHHNVPEACRERFLAEAQALARVSHPNVVTIHDVQGAGDELRLELELVEGENLNQIVERGGPLAAREAALVALDLCRALAAIHAAGLVHMDVKPANVMRASGGRIVLLDFGLTRHCAQDHAVPVGGTPAFMAPECYQHGAQIGPAADVYSLGVTLYWLVSGRYPYPTHMVQRLRELVLDREPRPLLDFRPDLPREFVALVTRAMQKEPAQRFPSIGAMEAALGRFVSESQAVTRSIRPLALVLGALLLTAAGFAWWAATRAPDFELEHEFRLVHLGEESVLEQGAVIYPGDELSLTVHVSEPVYLYLFQEDDVGVRHTLFPLPDSPPNPLPVGDLVLPANNTWKLVSAGGGSDHLYLVASTHPLPAAEELSQKLATPRYASPEGAPETDEEVFRGLQLVLRGDWALGQPASDAPVRSLADCFEGLRRSPIRSGLFFRHLDLRNP